MVLALPHWRDAPEPYGASRSFRPVRSSVTGAREPMVVADTALELLRVPSGGVGKTIIRTEAVTGDNSCATKRVLGVSSLM